MNAPASTAAAHDDDDETRVLRSAQGRRVGRSRLWEGVEEALDL
jgi:hypothetical protein